MADILCRMCGEPWEAYGVRHGDMEPAEARRFLAGEGCPCCGFGAWCVACDGTGRERDDYGGVAACVWCGGTRLVTVVRLEGDPGGRWCVAYDAKRGPVPEYWRIGAATLHVERYETRDGWAVRRLLACPGCRDTAPPCRTCEGTGAFQRPTDSEIDAGRVLAFLSSLDGATDGHEAEDAAAAIMRREGGAA